MENPKHTPGPWRPGYHSEADRRSEMIVRAEEIDDQPYVALCPWTPIGNHEANSLLIAAAPDLLAACQAFLACFDGKATLYTVRDQFERVTKMASVAVAKAFGEEPPK